MTLDLIMFGEDWGGLPSSTQHIARHLMARGHRVLWVNSIGLRRPSWRDAKRAGAKLGAALGAPRGGKAAGIESGPKPAAVIAPLAPPVPATAAERWLGRRMLGRRVRATAELLGMRRPLLWTSLPTAAYLVGACGEAGVVYYCCDDFGGLVGVDHAPVMAYERALAKRADHVLATSPALARRFEPAKTTILPHGVDYDLFSAPATPAPALLPPAGVAPGRPVAGFYGSVADWLDRDLLAEVARRLPEWEFQLVGRVACDVGPLAALPNLRFLPAVPHDALPGYVRHWTAALLPFRDTPQIRACDPLKLREYLASGTPIVATPFPAAEAYRDVVRVAAGPAAFAAAVADCWTEDPHGQRRRQARVADETWAARAATVEAILSRVAA